MPDLKLIGKVALVTGSSDGMGAAIAFEFSKEGAALTLTGRSQEKLAKIAEKCQSVSPKKLKPLTVAGDVTNEKVRKALIDQTVATFGKLDILVNNAGSYKSIPIEQNVGLGPLDFMLDVHVRAPYDLTKIAMPQLIKNKGIVINISTVASKGPSSVVPLMEYGMAKAAMDQFTYWTARELGSKGVRVNSINPGAIRTNIFASENPAEAEQILTEFGKRHALQRVGNPEEIARVAVFYASQDSSFITGTTLAVDGGFMVMPVGPLQN